MLLYNWKKIQKESNGNVKDILTILHILTYKLPPVNRHDRIYKFWQKSFHGHSFLVNPEPLFIQEGDIQIARLRSTQVSRRYVTIMNIKIRKIPL